MKYVLCSIDLPQNMQDSLMEDGWQTISIPPCSSLPSAIASHPDMQCCILNNAEIVLNPYLAKQLKPQLSSVFNNVASGDTGLHCSYPDDIAYNALVIGNTLFHLLNKTDSVIIDRAKQNGFTCVNVSQGYTACSTLVISDSALITADHGIAQAAGEQGYGVLLIQPAGISLPGYSCGFIGGASGWDGCDAVYFCGNVALHPDSEKIIAFIEQQGKSIKNLNDTNLHDYGGLKFVSR